MRSPSSLIFIVLLGVWAAYFVQYWIRRRDHLATARSVDQFTAAMRVLERRDTTPRTDLSAPAPPSYSVHPQRPVRPQVLVKRAVPAEMSRRSEVSVPTTSAPARTPAPEVQPAQAPSPSRPAPRRRAEPAAARQAGIRPSRRVRGILLLASLAELLVIVPLVALSMISVWALVPSLLAPVWAVAWLRSGVRAEQAAVRARRRRAVDRTHERTAAPAPVRATPPTARTATAARTAPASQAAPPQRADVVVEVDRLAEPASPVADETVTAPEVPAEPVAEVVDTPAVPVPLVDEDDIPLTWDPVPVPRPTYTMKARAERPEPAPAETTPAAAPAEDAGDAAYDDRRRVAGA